MNIVSDSFSVLRDHWQLTAGILLMVLLGGMLITSALKSIFRDGLTSEEYISLGAAGWILPLSLVSVLGLGWGAIQRSSLGVFILLACFAFLAILLFLRSRNIQTLGSKTFVWILAALFVASIFLRLAFVSKVIIPLYFDSAQHYLTTKNLLQTITSDETTRFTWPTAAYYHIGFHLLAALITSAVQAEIIHTMLILGQVIVAATPLALFALLRHETQSNGAALFGVLLAAFGWYMPAYAVNWGKYPALTSLPLITFVISLAYLSLRFRETLSRKNYLWLNGILILGILITALAHSRSLIVLAIVALSWTIASGWQKLSKVLQAIFFLAIMTGTILIILLIRTQDVFALLFDPYWQKGLWVTAGVLFLAVFAQWRYPRLTFASILVIFFLLGGLLVPIWVPGYGRLTLLDRPFVEMFLYLPLSVLGGAGLAGLERSLQLLIARGTSRQVGLSPYLSLLFVGLLLGNVIANYNFYPADCCSIVGRDDLVAIDWIDKNLPAQGRIAISSTELRVLPSDSPQGAAGADAGAWITPLTGRVTVPLAYQSDFSQPAIFAALCQKRVDYLYVGETGTIFNNGLIAPYPDRYRALLSMPTAKVYQVVGCPPQ